MNNKSLCKSTHIDLSSTLDGGQSFRWHKFENGFNGVINNKPFFIFQENKKIFVEAEDMNSNDMNLVFNYLSLDVDLKKISKKFKDNLYLNNLFKKFNHENRKKDNFIDGEYEDIDENDDRKI